MEIIRRGGEPEIRLKNLGGLGGRGEEGVRLDLREERGDRDGWRVDTDEYGARLRVPSREDVERNAMGRGFCKKERTKISSQRGRRCR